MNHTVVRSTQIRNGQWPAGPVCINAEQLAIGENVDAASDQLPQGWSILLELERGAAVVNLYDSDGKQRDFDTNHDSLSQEIADAIAYATSQDAIAPVTFDMSNQ